MLYVTKPTLPPLDEFIPYLREIWNSSILTNGGPFHLKLEAALCEYLGVKYISLFTNGTIALLTALQALKVTGEVITTPYSFVATSHSLLWNNIKPVFADICPHNLNLCPSKIEMAITPNTTAIMPVHCYGNPCDTKEINRIAKKYNLKVIYDAAHAFGVKDRDGSVLNHGDLSVLSFHATKVFNTFEGGAIVTSNPEMKEKIDQLKNFGIKDEITVDNPGINGKMSEFNAALGLIQLEGIDRAISARKELYESYLSELANIRGIRFIDSPSHCLPNYSYCPIMVGPDFLVSRDKLYEILKSNGVYSRKYFYPLISNFPMYSHLESSNKEHLKNANIASEQILCLPIYSELEKKSVRDIASIIKGAKN